MSLAVVNKTESTSSRDFCQPVYEQTNENAAGQRLVLTTWMLLDELKQCQEEIERLIQYVNEAGVEDQQHDGCAYNPIAVRLEKAHFNVSHILRLLWRSGLWTEDNITERTDSEGRTFRVLEEPFTDGKPQGRYVAENAPRWQRELLGLPMAASAEPQARNLADSLRFLDKLNAAIKHAA